MFISLFEVIGRRVDEKTGRPLPNEHKLVMRVEDDAKGKGYRKVLEKRDKLERDRDRNGRPLHRVYILRTITREQIANRATRRWFRRMSRKLLGQLKTEAQREMRASELAIQHEQQRRKSEDMPRTKGGIWLPWRRGSQREGKA